MAQQSRALRTRDALIESAARTFDEQGFARASLSVISSRAGVSNGALHHHFSSKASLARAVGAAAEHRLTRITGAHEGRPPGAGALQLLIDATHVLVRDLEQDVVLRAGFHAARSLDRSGVPAGSRRLWAHWVRQTLDRARREGALRQDVSADAVTATVVATVLGLGVPVPGPPARRADAVTHLWRLLLPTIAPQGLAARLVPSGTPAGAGRELSCG